MKYILALCLTIGTLKASQLPLPKSKKDCFAAYTLFKAQIKSCANAYTSNGIPIRQIDCINKLHARFITECQIESGIIDRNLN
jgi:hypothetical protein